MKMKNQLNHFGACTHHNVEDDDAVALGRNHHARGGWKRVRGRAQLRDERVPWLERVSGRRSDSDSLVLRVVVVVVFDEYDDDGARCVFVRACVRRVSSVQLS
jgi:hypothetical protein